MFTVSLVCLIYLYSYEQMSIVHAVVFVMHVHAHVHVALAYVYMWRRNSASYTYLVETRTTNLYFTTYCQIWTIWFYLLLHESTCYRCALVLDVSTYTACNVLKYIMQHAHQSSLLTFHSTCSLVTYFLYVRTCCDDGHSLRTLVWRLPLSLCNPFTCSHCKQLF